MSGRSACRSRCLRSRYVRGVGHDPASAAGDTDEVDQETGDDDHDRARGDLTRVLPDDDTADEERPDDRDPVDERRPPTVVPGPLREGASTLAEDARGDRYGV